MGGDASFCGMVGAADAIYPPPWLMTAKRARKVFRENIVKFVLDLR